MPNVISINLENPLLDYVSIQIDTAQSMMSFERDCRDSSHMHPCEPPPRHDNFQSD